MVLGMEEKLSKEQIKKGLIITAVFVLLRFLLIKFLGIKNIAQFSLKQPFPLISWFLIGSVGLVYFGFVKWAGIDIREWWFKKEKVLRIVGHVLIGVLSIVLLFILNMIIGLVVTKLSPMPVEALQATQLSADALGSKLWLFVLVNFMTASFQEETIFRGFLQDVFTQKFGSGKAILLQAALFAFAYIGRFPSNVWQFYVVVVFNGLFYGWLKKKRGILLVPGIPHAVLG